MRERGETGGEGERERGSEGERGRQGERGRGHVACSKLNNQRMLRISNKHAYIVTTIMHEDRAS